MLSAAILFSRCGLERAIKNLATTVVTEEDLASGAADCSFVSAVTIAAYRKMERGPGTLARVSLKKVS